MTDSNPSSNPPFQDNQTLQQQLAAAGQAPQAPAAPDMNAMVTVKVDGVPKQVTLGEALNGYVAQSTLTQRMQEMAQERQKYAAMDTFFQQLEADPSSMIRKMQDRYGVAGTPATGDDPAGEQPDPEVEAMKRELAELRTAVSTQTHTSRMERQIQDLGARFPDQFDRDAVMAYATANSIGDIEQAFKLWSFDQPKVQTPDQGAEGAPQGVPLAQNPDVLALVDAKVESLNGVSTGSAPQGVPQGQGERGPAGTPEEAFDRALEKLGFGNLV